VEAVAISPDGRSLASAGDDGTIRFWSLATGAEQISLSVPQPAILYDVTFSPDGKRLLACGVSRGRAAVFEWSSE
jgi:WD40 repeat protein